MVALPPSGGGHVEVWPPTLQSAVGVSARSIRLTWYYSLSPSNKFKFERTNLTYGTKTEFEIAVPAITHNYTFDDDDGGIGLDPQTSYSYRVAAYHPEFPGYTPWSSPATGTTFDAPFEPAVQASLGLDSQGWQGRCLVQRISGFSKGGRQLRVVVRASSTKPAYVDRLFISRVAPSGDPYDSASDLVEVAPKFQVDAGRSLTLSAIRYTLDPNQPLLIAVDFSPSPPAAPSGVSYMDVFRIPVLDAILRMLGMSNLMAPLRRRFGFGPLGRAYWAPGAQASLADRGPGFTQEERIYFVERVEVR
jgi:hypothetical protein